MALTVTTLLSFLSKAAAARSVYGRISAISEATLVTTHGARGWVELRGTYGGYPACVHICLVWGSARLKLRPKEELDFLLFPHRDEEMDRGAYERWESAQDPEWDAGAGIEARRYLSDHVYFERQGSLGHGNPWQELERFERLPSALQQRILEAMEVDRNGNLALRRDVLELGVSRRIFWLKKPEERIMDRLSLARDVLDWLAGRAVFAGEARAR